MQNKMLPLNYSFHTFPLSISINTEISPRKQWSRKTSQNAQAVAQCPVGKVWRTEHRTVTQPIPTTYFDRETVTLCEICLIPRKKDTQRWSRNYEMSDITIRWVWHVHSTGIHGLNTLPHVKLCCALVLLSLTVCCAEWGHNCLSVLSFPPIKKALWLTRLWYCSFILSLDDAFQRGPRWCHCQMCPK